LPFSLEFRDSRGVEGLIVVAGELGLAA
jgi:hypothetical protein